MRTAVQSFPLKTKYSNYAAFEVLTGFYPHGPQSPYMAFNSLDGQPILTASVNLEEQHIIPEDGNIIIKNWSENEGILDWLIENKIVTAPVMQHENGYVIAYECTILKTEWFEQDTRRRAAIVERSSNAIDDEFIRRENDDLMNAATAAVVAVVLTEDSNSNGSSIEPSAPDGTSSDDSFSGGGGDSGGGGSSGDY